MPTMQGAEHCYKAPFPTLHVTRFVRGQEEEVLASSVAASDNPGDQESARHIQV